MQFTTKILLQKSHFSIDYDSKIMLFGSCFSENIGAKFEYFKFKNIVNPFGIIFNAVAIKNIILRIISQKSFTENDVFFHNDLWNCYEIHSALSHEKKDILLENLNKILMQSSAYLAETTHFFFTLGTSWVYRKITSNQVVANCHKMPQNNFSKEILSLSDTKKSIENIVLMIARINPNAQIIFTVSPVRHIKDGFFENNVSKAILLQAIFELIHSKKELLTVDYFPSYEIIMDELRDYRFFESDMLHPNALAISYVWERLVWTYIKENELETMQEITNIQKMLQHRPNNSNTNEHKKLLAKIETTIQKLKKNNPNISFLK